MDVAPLFAPSEIELTTIPQFVIQIFGRALGTSGFFSQNFTIPASSGRPAYTKLNFDARFTNLAQVAFFDRAFVSSTSAACTADQCLFQFDNINGVLATPEPGSTTLLATGLVALLGVVRRRRSRAP